ncbi:MAG: Ada metal-binding domain-containing protein [Ideonella sp.]
MESRTSLKIDASAEAAPAAPRNAEADYQAIVARDARFDGNLFVGVSSTGIYCRPICRVRTPKRQNCRFFASAAQAEAAAFRPCLKCRPELAPGDGDAWTVMDASRTLARQAALLLDNATAAGIADGNTPGIAALAVRLGVSDRHLRRIFIAEHGVTPLQYLQTRRLLLAKQLLTETTLPITQVALASGFRSLRRFNAVFVERYRLNPGRLRLARATEPSAPAAGIGVQLVYRTPFDKIRLLAFFAQRAIPGIESVDAGGVQRSLREGALSAAHASPAGWVQARFDASRPLVHLQFSSSLLSHSGLLLGAARRWLDLDAQPAVIDAALRDLPGEPGLRLPGSLDGFELAVRAVLGQQVTVAGARTLACRLVERFGKELTTPWPTINRCFPDPRTLAAAPIESIASLGIIRSRAHAIIALGAAWPSLGNAMSPGSSPHQLIEGLCALPGIGPWTAHYIAMRTLAWPDAFPPGDVAVLKAIDALQRAPQIHPQASALQPIEAGPPPISATARRAAAEQIAQQWQPWRSYAVLRLWNSLGSADPSRPPNLKVPTP